MNITTSMIPIQSVSEKLVADAMGSFDRKPTVAVETTVESVAGTTSYTSVGSTIKATVEGPIVASPDANLYNRLGQITQKMSDQTQRMMSIMEPMTAQVEQAQVTTLDITV